MPYKDIEKKRAYQRKKMALWRAKHPEDNKRRCAESYLRHKEKRLSGMREWKRQNPELARASQLISAARKRNVVCTLELQTIADKIKAGVCEITGLKFILSEKKASPWSPSLDRINGAEGYTPENTRVVVWLYNCAKNEFTDEDVKVLAEALTVEKVAPNIIKALK